MPHVFISYKSNDRDYVHALADALRANDYEVWLDARGIPGSADWEDEIQAALDNAYAVILVMTPAAEESPWVRREKIYAEERKRPIIPLLRQGKMWFSLSNLQYVDARAATVDDPAPAGLYAALLLHAPRTLDTRTTTAAQTGTPAQLRRLMPDLRETAEKVNSPRGLAARELLEQLAKHSDAQIAARAQLELGDLPPLPAEAYRRIIPPAAPKRRNIWPYLAVPAVAAAVVIVLVAALSARQQPTNTVTPTAQVALPPTDNVTATIQAGIAATDAQNTRIAQAATPTPTPTVTPTATITPSPTPRPTDTPFDVNDLIAKTFAAEATRTAIAIASFTKTPTATYTPSDTPTNTPDVPGTVAKAVEMTRTANAIASFTKTPTPTATFTPSKTPTATLTPSDTPTATFTPSDTPTATFTPSDTPTATFTPSKTPTPTPLPPGAQRTDDFGVVQVWVPAGCFKMSSDPNIDKSAGTDEQPQREVCLTHGYWIDQLEVTNAAYQKFIDAGGYTNRAYWSDEGWNLKGDKTEDYDGFTDPQQPRVGVTWYEAEAYANWRGCRLPTEAEWEYAARGPNSRIYPWGKDFVPDNVVYYYNSGGKTAVVGPNIRTAGASWVGALDMSGNVWEWVADWYQADYYRVGPKDNPTGPASGSGRAVRGGSWRSSEDAARASSRYDWYPNSRYVDQGFRLVCAAPVSHLSDR